jgi:hypothetical protein
MRTDQFRVYQRMCSDQHVRHVRRAEKKFPLSRENGPCSVAMPNHALLSRRLQHDTPHDEVQRVGPVLMLFVVRPILLK